MSRGQDGHAGTEGVVEPITDEERIHEIIFDRLVMDSPSGDEAFMADEVIEYLRKNGFVIAPAQDVITPDQRAAMEWVQKPDHMRAIYTVLTEGLKGTADPEHVKAVFDFSYLLERAIAALATGGHDGQ